MDTILTQLTFVTPLLDLPAFRELGEGRDEIEESAQSSYSQLSDLAISENRKDRYENALVNFLRWWRSYASRRAKV